MPTTTSLTTTYAGELAGEIVAKALLSNVSTQYVTMKPNVPYKSVVRKIDDTVTFAAGTCDFTPTGTITLTERILTLEEFQVQRQICKKDFFTDWSADHCHTTNKPRGLLCVRCNAGLGYFKDNSEHLTDIFHFRLGCF